MRKIILLFLIPAFVLFSGCTITGSYGQVEAFDMTVSPAHELRGASSYLEPHKNTMRLSGNIHAGRKKEGNISGLTNKVGDCKDIVNCPGFYRYSIRENVDGVYMVDFPLFSASFDFIKKFEDVILGVNAGYDNGFDGNFVLGYNTEYFEIGAALGLWLLFRDFHYSGTEYNCIKYLRTSEEELKQSSFERSSDKEILFTYGGFASVYFGLASLNYSINIYRPNPSYSEDSDGDKMNANFDFPLVVTQYITLGLRVHERIDIRLGTVNIFGGFSKSHWAFNGGIGFYIK